MKHRQLCSIQSEGRANLGILASGIPASPHLAHRSGTRPLVASHPPSTAREPETFSLLVPLTTRPRPDLTLLHFTLPWPDPHPTSRAPLRLSSPFFFFLHILATRHFGGMVPYIAAKASPASSFNLMLINRSTS